MKDEWDFGFTAVDESDLDISKQSAIRLEEENDFLNAELKTARNSLEEIRKMIMPLLNNLMMDSDKDYIHWPGRDKKIKSLIEKINTHYMD